MPGVTQVHYHSMMRRLAIFASESRDIGLILLLLENHKILAESRQLSPNTLRAYRKAITDYLRFADADSPLHETSTAEISDFIAFLENPRAPDPNTGKRGRPSKAKALAPNSIMQRISALRSLFVAFSWVGLCKVNPVDLVRRRRSEAPPSQDLVYYTDIEVLELLAAADAHDVCLVLLAAHGGLTVSELNALRWQVISFEDQTMQIGGANPGTVHLSNKLSMSLQKHQREQNTLELESEFVLDLRTQTGLYKRIKNLCAVSGVEFKGVHALRNSCGRKLLSLTGDARAVQEHLRLRSIEQVQHFNRADVPLATTVAAMEY